MVSCVIAAAVASYMTCPTRRTASALLGGRERGTLLNNQPSGERRSVCWMTPQSDQKQHNARLSLPLLAVGCVPVPGEGGGGPGREDLHHTLWFGALRPFILPRTRTFSKRHYLAEVLMTTLHNHFDIFDIFTSRIHPMTLLRLRHPQERPSDRT